MKLKIETGIPIPSRKGRKLSEEATLLQSMKKGESLFVEKRITSAVQLAIRYIGKGKYTCRAEGGGTRIWRIK